MIVLECANCGTQWPATLKKSWGKTKETNGYGPTMMCVALVVAEGAPLAPNDEVPHEVCGGTLAAIDVLVAPRLVALTPNT